ncbi:hypothetical protein [Aneurinibacillus aneurinilyticus]|uniref:Uncharacterized protein n=1 Tax=Aneurinibacillus aneurinilyticus ATCC 12856 TaxID=649747 RepID=U1X7B0_ANEAE|nr:hypothetical protein [Aneurinibacillus aneurinilyticus]ERI10850.1 hypothetical protein HMPREF0083_01038 [Aneurinibacillus aneurinilyticus ATCC 12856]MED0704916.1 hypothetical protein [Aneurinibacillus aneurinilyticus]MED0724042.1 hypothetical protein [Aneurinibacillus aneurinilyticus]MED0731961.1 hypothetical protein [Aneurinibacillus aneurinilyticus]MED0741509.1 hypothetical protein [Aneurinibacillus aneurinilyticus]
MTNTDKALALMLPRLKSKESRRMTMVGNTAIRMIEQHLNSYESKRSWSHGTH